MKKIGYSIIIIIALAISTVSVKASETETEIIEVRTTNVEDMTDSEVTELSKYVVNSIVDKSISSMKQYNDCFTNEALTQIQWYVTNNKISGTPSNIVSDWVYPEYSTTGDSVLMINAKIQNENFNNLYLVELHINKDGKIYGYNVWAY